MFRQAAVPASSEAQCTGSGGLFSPRAVEEWRKCNVDYVSITTTLQGRNQAIAPTLADHDLVPVMPTGVRLDVQTAREHVTIVHGAHTTNWCSILTHGWHVNERAAHHVVAYKHGCATPSGWVDTHT